MSYNSTHTALLVLGAIVVSGFYFGVDVVTMVPLLGPLAAYITLREKSRIKNHGT